MRPVFSVWLGAEPALRAAFETQGLPTYSTETDAVRGIMHLVEYRRRYDELTRTPDAMPQHIDPPDRARATNAVRSALQAGRRWLDPQEAADLLSAYGIPTPPVRRAATGAEAADVAAAFISAGQTCVVKIESPDITHKSEVNGVRLNLATCDAVRDAANDVISNAARLRPDARISGVTVQPMIVRPGARELLLGVATDPTFGRLIVFGQGGVAVEVLKDSALDLLPIDLAQANMLISRTRVSGLLHAYRNVPAVDIDSLALILVRLSRLVEDLPEIVALDLNPLLADAEGCLAIDARIEVAAEPPSTCSNRWRRFAVRPYPREWEREVTVANGQKLRIRPIKPVDEHALEAMLSYTSSADLRLHVENQEIGRRKLHVSGTLA